MRPKDRQTLSDVMHFWDKYLKYFSLAEFLFSSYTQFYRLLSLLFIGDRRLFQWR